LSSWLSWDSKNGRLVSSIFGAAQYTYLSVQITLFQQKPFQILQVIVLKIVDPATGGVQTFLNGKIHHFISVKFIFDEQAKL